MDDIYLVIEPQETNIYLVLENSTGGGGGNANIMRKYKTGANVIGNSVSLASDNIPDDCLIQVYINGVTGWFSPTYNDDTKVIDNLPDTVNSDILKFVITY